VNIISEKQLLKRFEEMYLLCEVKVKKKIEQEGKPRATEAANIPAIYSN
jgi:hypothetical protein